MLCFGQTNSKKDPMSRRTLGKSTPTSYPADLQHAMRRFLPPTLFWLSAVGAVLFAGWMPGGLDLRVDGLPLRRVNWAANAKGPTMSQTPPPPPQPPYGGYQPPDDPEYSIPLRRNTNVPAIVSLVCGLTLCIPFATGLLAVVFGVVGLRKANDPRRTGRGMAMAGIILGVISLVGWIVISFAVWRGYQQVRPGLALIDTYLGALAAGDVAAAQANATDNVPPERLAQLSQQVQPLGPYRGFTPTDARPVEVNGTTGWDFTGRARFGQTDTTVRLTLVRVDAAWRIHQTAIGDGTAPPQ